MLFGALLVSPLARAVSLDINGFYFSDNVDFGTGTIANNRMFFDAALSIKLDKKGQYSLGWSYGLITYNLETSQNTEASNTDTGPRFSWFMNKDQTWSLGFTYNLFANSTFTNAGTEVSLRGKSYKIDIGYTGPITAKLYLGIRLNYYSASYGEQFDASDTFSEVSNSKSFIYPSLAASYRFN